MDKLSNPAPPPRFASTRVPKTRNKMVLIAVDDANAAQAYRQQLDENGFSSMRVATTNELLEVVDRLLPGFALVDVDSPLLGLNVARRVRMAAREVLLIGLMWAPTPAFESVARNAGFDGTLAKASAHETLVTKLLSFGGHEEPEDARMRASG